MLKCGVVEGVIWVCFFKKILQIKFWSIIQVDRIMLQKTLTLLLSNDEIITYRFMLLHLPPYFPSFSLRSAAMRLKR
jgi:hypothetical protein